MNVYRPSKMRRFQIAALLLRFLARAFSLWPLWLVLIVLVPPVGPHLRVQYSYVERGSVRVMRECWYLGGRGVVYYQPKEICPLIAVMDGRQHR